MVFVTVPAHSFSHGVKNRTRPWAEPLDPLGVLIIESDVFFVRRVHAHDGR